MAEELGISLATLPAIPGARKKKVRRGRGIGSGLGKTAGRGGKGQTARSGKGRPKGFEGGQMPLYRRLPKWGFKNPFKKNFEIVNVSFLETNFSNGDIIELAKLKEKGLLKPRYSLLKVLGEGTITKNLIVRAHRFSKSAIQKINQAGGKVEELALPQDKPEEKKLGSS